MYLDCDNDDRRCEGLVDMFLNNCDVIVFYCAHAMSVSDDVIMM